MASSSAEVDSSSTATISPTTSGTAAPATSSTVDTEALITSEFDLTSTIAGYLDRHLVFPLLEFLQEQKIYAEEEMLRAKLELLSKTSMVDFAIRNYYLLNKTEEAPAAMREHREAVVHRLRTLQAEAAPLLAVLDNAEVVTRLRSEKCFTMAHLMDNFSITLANLDALYSWAKLQFDIGKYPSAATYLAYYRVLSNNAEKNASALWGKFAAEILMLNWEAALADMTALKDLIDAKSFASPIMQLQQRTWLIHWSLFVFFNHPNGRNGIIELFLQERYLNAIQTTCPHMLRYLTTAVITNKRKKPVLKELVKVIQQESYTYRDPITELLEALYVNFDFEVAQEKLRQCEKVLYNDFFLIACRDEFIENARLFIFETYCRIHQCIDIDRLALKLNMDQSAAEKWIVNLIRNARLDAKIDSAANNIIMGAQYPSVYQQVIEKTKGLTLKSSLLAQNIEKR